MKKLVYQIGKSVNRQRRRLLYYGQPRYFCIGRNKTGTTSVARAFRDLNIRVGDQREAELLSRDYFNGDFMAIKSYCQYALAFQDVPFSWPGTYRYMYDYYPNSKFILTIRDSADEWYQSLRSFHQKIYGGLTWSHLENSDYVYPGWSRDNRRNLYGLGDNDDPYDKGTLIDHYNKHNEEVVNFFNDKKDSLLVLNLKEKDAYQRFCAFIDRVPLYESFPWENKTANIE